MENPISIEITIISAEGLKTTSSNSLFCRHNRLRPFVSLSTIPSDGHKPRHVYGDDRGGGHATWGDRFSLHVDDASCGVHLQLYTKRLLLGRAHLGFCLIPAHDIWADPIGSTRFLSYRLRRDGDGSRTNGIVNLSVRVVGFQRALPTCQTVIGIPIGSYSGIGQLASTCQPRFVGR